MHYTRLTRAEGPARLAAEVDDEHREAMRTIHEDLAAQAAGISRRGLLRGLGAGGAALAGAGVLVATAGAAAAQSATTVPAGAATTTTTSPPTQATSADLAVVAFAQSLELAAVSAYETTLASNTLLDEVAVVAKVFRDHHRDHAAAWGALAGRAASGKANQAILDSLKLEKVTNQVAALDMALRLENAAAATYLYTIGALQALDPARAAASILPIESRHAVVLAQLLNQDISEYMPSFETISNAIDPTKYAE